MNFAAPEASVLIVDDNEINLEVTAALLEPLRMKVDLADSGKKALQLAQKKRYNLIFMDHMMPVMDGVETTKQLRQMQDAYYRTVPVVALTANALSEIREECSKAGMNDYVAKPVEAKALYRCILRWLPKRLIVITKENQALSMSGSVSHTARTASGIRAKADAGTGGAKEDSRVLEHLPDLPGIDPAEGIRFTGGEKMWLKLLGDFYKLIDAKANKLESCLADGLIRDYTIEVHALKNTARMIGAAHLSEWFFKMEKCGKAGEIETIKKETPGLLQEMRSYKEILRRFGEENDRNKRESSAAEWITQLKIMRDAMERFSVDTVDACMQQLEQYRVPEGCGGLMDSLRVAVTDVKMKDVMDTAEQMIAVLQKTMK